jgi:gliding motility-associated-like protein
MDVFGRSSGKISRGLVFITPSEPEAFLDDKKPKAKDDEIVTQEETPVQANILLNDDEDSGPGPGPGPGPGDNEDQIDPTTIDLDPETEILDQTLITDNGTFTVNSAGDLNYVPLTDFFGNSRISYTVQNLRGEKSNKANITVAVTNTNDPPVITGQNPDPLIVNEDGSLTIGFANLSVTDPDNTYPNGFTLSLVAGTNYTITNNVITPTPNYSGPLSVPVSVSDGTSSSNEFVLTVTVNAVNDVPVVTAQNANPINATEEQPFTINVTDLSVTDPDDMYPTDFTIVIPNGASYTASGNTITLAPNFAGALTVPVMVNDGAANSASFDVQVMVANVNDAPQIISQSPLATGEDQPLTIDFADLTVNDPDNVYPGGFTMNLADGDNYSVLGTTVTPDTDFTGTLNVPVTVSDGALTSNELILTITVSNSNDAPVITGQSLLSVDEDNTITVTLAHLTITDSDNPDQTGFTVAVGAGSNYTLSGNTVIPGLNFSGTLNVPVSVSDGQSSSNVFPLTITVNSINDAPAITGQVTLITNESTPLALSTNNFTVTDPDNSYPTGFTLIVLAGANYTASGATVTPGPGFNGSLSVSVQVNDGTTDSNIFPATVSVSAVNDPPLITGSNPVSGIEDTAIPIQLSNLIVTDSDNSFPTGFTFTLVPGTNYTVSGPSIIPASNFSGALSVGVFVNDGLTNSNTFQLPVTVTPVNDAPLITSQQTITIAEDQSVAIDFANLVVSDPDNTYPTGFTLILFTGINYTISETTIIPNPDFKGTLSVPVQVSDGQLSSNVFQIQVIVSDVNDTPVITGQTPVSTSEDTPVSISLSNLMVLDPDNNYPTGFTLAIGSGANYSVLGASITPSQDFNGTLNIPVTVNDGGSTSAPFNFQIQVGDANDPPLIIAQTPLNTNEETAIVLALTNLSVTDPDNPYPTGFTLTVAPGENYTFENLVVVPVPNFIGTLTVPVRVNDGVNNSPNFNLSIQVNPINDAPSFDAIANQTVQENGNPSNVQITGITPGLNENDQQLTFTTTSSNDAVIPTATITYAGGSTAGLVYTLSPNTSGVVTITVTATDNGQSTAPHQNTYSSTFQVNVAEVNNAPTLDNIANITLVEDAPMQSVSLSGITAGDGETQSLAIELTTDKPALFETLSAVYTSPQNTGTIQIKPSANSNGVASVSVRVTDGGSNTSPSVNFILKPFTVTIQAVNDIPVFTSVPVGVAAVNEPYEYLIQFSDVETSNLAVLAMSKPTWSTLAAMGNGRFRLAGTPPASAQGEVTVDLQIKDSGQTATQRFNLVVNNRPIAKPVAVRITEDNSYTFTETDFASSYSDIDQHAMKAILVQQLPPNGKLTVGDLAIKANDTIDVASISQLKYQPNPNYDKPDVFFWKAFDGYHFSAVQASVDIAITPVNDPPVITISQDTLQYEVNGEPAIVAQLFQIDDPDNDSLNRAEITFTVNHDRQYDQLIVQSSGGVRGIYEPETGRIVLTGLAPISEYVNVISKIQFNYLNTLDPVLRMKTVTYTASDGEATSEPKDRLINLKYTFIELEIPSGFTPNGDAANDRWIISRPGGLEQLQGALIRVMNRRGVVVYEAHGFNEPWDGTMNGESLPADSYFFSIDLNLRSKKTYKGVVTILR